MSKTLILRNRQKVCRVDLRFLRRILDQGLNHLAAANINLGIYLVASPEITHLNETFLGHAGETDVISFDYSENKPPTNGARTRSPAPLQGEIFVCVNEAVRQAKKFRTSWQSELTRYIVHGILHLLGYDDATPRQGRVMKHEEDRLVRQLSRQFDLSKLALSARKRKPRLSA